MLWLDEDLKPIGGGYYSEGPGNITHNMSDMPVVVKCYEDDTFEEARQHCKDYVKGVAGFPGPMAKALPMLEGEKP